MNKSKINLLLILLFVLLSSTFVFSKEEPVISAGEMRKLDKKGRVHLLKMLEDGRTMFFSERENGENRLLIASRGGRVSRSYKIPVRKVDYITCSDDGDALMIYTQDTLEFYYIHGRGMKCKSIFRFEKGKKGFALYGKENSKILFAHNGIYARGYYYDSNNTYLEDAIVKVNPDKWGIAVFDVIVETNRLLEAAQAFYRTAKETGNLEVCGNYFIFTPRDENGGIIMVFDTEKELLYKLDDFKDITGMAVSPDKSLLIYTFVKTRDYKLSGEMVLYNLKNKKVIKKWQGRYFNPRFDEKGEQIAVGLMNPLYEGRYITHINIIPVPSGSKTTEEKKPDIHEIIPGIKPIDWRFVNDARELYMFTGEDIYKWKLK